ncbi:MAG: MOSC domain-containing protein [Terriglobia bacterium]
MGIVEQISRSNGGMPKRAITGPVMLQAGGIEGDRHRNMLVHGGPNRAVLMISAEVVDALAAGGHPVGYGSLGENFTVRGLNVSLWRSGQRYRVGEDAVIELTKLRVPCANLLVFGAQLQEAIWDELCRAGDTTSPHWAFAGFYARVIKPGLLIAGAPITLESDLA